MNKIITIIFCTSFLINCEIKKESKDQYLPILVDMNNEEAVSYTHLTLPTKA